MLNKTLLMVSAGNSTCEPIVVSVEPSKLAMERRVGETDEYGVAVSEWNITPVSQNQTDIDVSGGVPALLGGVIMGDTQSGAVTFKDATTSIQSIAPGANLKVDYDGAKFNTSLVITTAASAGCVVLWRTQ